LTSKLFIEIDVHPSIGKSVMCYTCISRFLFGIYEISIE